VQSPGQRAAVGKLGNRHAQLLRERAVTAAGQLGETGSWAAPGRGSNGEQITGIRQRSKQTAPAQPGPALKQRIRSEEAGERQANRDQQGQAPGCDRCRRQRHQASEGDTSELAE
jgi:hypothetical protein